MTIETCITQLRTLAPMCSPILHKEASEHLDRLRLYEARFPALREQVMAKAQEADAEIAELRAKLDTAAEALGAAGDQFRHYAELHRAKSPPDTAKAEANAAMAARCDAALERMGLLTI